MTPIHPTDLASVRAEATKRLLATLTIVQRAILATNTETGK